jgi:alpha-amylase
LKVEFCSVGDSQVPLPDLNTENEFVASTFYTWIRDIVAKYDFDGIRIDTFRHVQKPFWTNYTRSSGVYSVGEVATSETDYVGSYTYYANGVLHYPLYFALNVTFRDDPQWRQSMRVLEQQVQENGKYFKDTTLCGVFLDNHDRVRFLNYTQNPTRIQNALVYLLFSDGIPMLYYGTEQNFTGK